MAVISVAKSSNLDTSNLPPYVSYWSKNKLKLSGYFALLTTTCVLMCGTAFSWFNLVWCLQNKYNLYVDEYWAHQSDSWYTIASGLNPLGSAISGFINTRWGARVSSAFCTIISTVGAIMICVSFYQRKQTPVAGAGLCLLSFGEAGSAIYLAPMAYLFPNPTMLYTYLAALFAASSFPFMVIEAMVKKGTDLSHAFLGFTILIGLSGTIGTFIWPKDFVAMKTKHDEVYNPEYVTKVDGETPAFSKKKAIMQGLSDWKFWGILCLGSLIQIIFTCYLGSLNGQYKQIYTELGVSKHDLSNKTYVATTVSSIISGLIGIGITPIAQWITNNISPKTYLTAVVWAFPTWSFFLYSKTVWSIYVTMCLFYICKTFWFSAFYSFLGLTYSGEVYGTLIGIVCLGFFVLVELSNLIKYSPSAPLPKVADISGGICCCSYLFAVLLTLSYLGKFFKKNKNVEVEDSEQVEVEAN